MDYDEECGDCGGGDEVLACVVGDDFLLAVGEVGGAKPEADVGCLDVYT